MNIIESVKDKGSAAMSTASQINAQVIDKLDASAKLNLSTLSYFTDIGFRQLRAMSAIRDMESLRKFSADTVSLTSEVTKRLYDDSKAWLSLGADIKDTVAQSFSKAKDDTSEAIGTMANEIKQKTVSKVPANPNH